MKDCVVYSENKSEVTYNQLISKDNNELPIEEYPHHGPPETRPKVKGSSSQTYRLTTVILGILCVVLISTIIGLCISYKGLSEKHIVLSQNSSETNSILEELKSKYTQLTAALMKVQKSLQDSIQTVRDMERQRADLLQRQKEALTTDGTNLQAHNTMPENSNQRCPVGWEQHQSSCYFLSQTETDQQLSWYQSRKECQHLGADLVVIDSQEKQEFISRILKGRKPSSVYWHFTGHWIGLRDVETEGVWKWLNGTELTMGFWFDGEPNDQYSAEDCAATYPKKNPLKTWNDAPCDFNLHWICEIKL